MVRTLTLFLLAGQLLTTVCPCCLGRKHLANYCLIPSCLPVDTTSAGCLGSMGSETKEGSDGSWFPSVSCLWRQEGFGKLTWCEWVPERTGAADDPDFSRGPCSPAGSGDSRVAAVLAHTPGPCRAPPETERETSSTLMRFQLVTS